MNLTLPRLLALTAAVLALLACAVALPQLSAQYGAPVTCALVTGLALWLFVTLWGDT
jgi:hypothetical protein